MKKLSLPAIALFAAACSYQPPEQEVQKIFARHSYQEHAPEKIAAALKAGGAAGLAALDARAAVLKGKKPLRARPAEKSISSGLLLGERAGGLVLLKVFEDSPAAAAGFRSGDRVTALGGGAPSAAAVRDVVGRNTSYQLKAERPGAVPLEAEVFRDSYFFPQVFAFYDEDTRTAFLRLGLFFEGSAEAALAAAGAAAARGAQGLVIDLRDNQGGVPAEAAAVLKAFAAKPGPVLEVRSRQPGYAALYAAEGRGRFAGMRLAALVNGGTAMAAEVFARSLKETAGAVLVGEPTAGSVSVTRAFALGGGRGLELTVARLFPPSGADLEGAAVAPDAAVEAGRLVWDNSREATLLGDAAWARALELLKSPAPTR